jgi:hypothetical protein
MVFRGDKIASYYNNGQQRRDECVSTHSIHLFMHVHYSVLGAAPPTRRTLSVAEKSAQWHHCVLAVSLFLSLCMRSEWAFKARLNIIILLHKSTAACATSLNMLCAARTQSEMHAGTIQNAIIHAALFLMSPIR